jgi:hypothetical protein
MAKGRKTGGRTTGTPNKRTQAVTEKLETLGCDPIKGMARIAMDETVEINIRAQMFKELAQYVAPKRKAMEVTGEDGTPIELAVKQMIAQIQNEPLTLPSKRNPR